MCFLCPQHVPAFPPPRVSAVLLHLFLVQAGWPLRTGRGRSLSPKGWACIATPLFQSHCFLVEKENSCPLFSGGPGQYTGAVFLFREKLGPFNPPFPFQAVCCPSPFFFFRQTTSFFLVDDGEGCCFLKKIVNSSPGNRSFPRMELPRGIACFPFLGGWKPFSQETNRVFPLTMIAGCIFFFFFSIGRGGSFPPLEGTGAHFSSSFFLRQQCFPPPLFAVCELPFPP